MQYKISFADETPIAEFASFEFAQISAKAFSKMMPCEIIVLRSTFFTYVFRQGIEQ